ncbi:cobalamin B12-binding domain-containing protein [Desulfatibacillum aliphaticivorans]|uniref:cobalamin B12-binding domain-containing protein n=1 Tax=Desulfatibacillum aliphaticivorans TaxID=218208 RepID=UPI00041DA33B|nr:cobalamin-dependent protein [Desulfatibacillum aliphaticivorans]
MSNDIAALMAELEEEKVLALVKKQLEEGVDVNAILAACQEGMIGVGKKFEEGTYYISDLMMAGEIFKQINEEIGPNLASEQSAKAGKVIVGTVKDDIHDIGKDLVVGMLQSANMDVTDLGVDVPAEKFVEAVKETGATVVSLSALLTVAFDSIKETVEAFEKAGLRDKVKIMIGGGPIDETVCKYTGADNWGADAQAAVTLARGWLS